MKLSNKILVGFFGFILLYLTAAFTELGIRGTPHTIDDKNSIAESIEIPNIIQLSLSGVDKEINVRASEKPRLELRSLSGDLLKNLKYRISGDTLTLSGIQPEDLETIKITVFVSEASLRKIEVNSSVAIIKGLESDVLNISQKSANVWLSECTIDKLEIDLSKSYLDISAMMMDTLNATLERSEVNVNTPVEVIQGSMTNNATLRLSDIREIQLKKDATSKVTMYQ
jgi:hypothetical protein